MIFDYLEDFAEMIEFLLALGSIIGMLGLIIGLLGWLILGQFQRKKMIGLILVSVILLRCVGSIQEYDISEFINKDAVSSLRFTSDRKTMISSGSINFLKMQKLFYS